DDELFENEAERLKVISMNEIERENFIYDKRQQQIKEKEREQLLGKTEGKDKDHGKDKDNASEEGEILAIEINQDEESLDSFSSLDIYHEEQRESIIRKSDIEKIKLGRIFFENNFEKPNFDDNVAKAFIRINLGSTKMDSQESGYILCQIKEIKQIKDKPYKFMGKKIDKRVEVTDSGVAGPFCFNYISNSNITDKEFDEFKKRMEEAKIDLPTKEEIKGIQKNIQKIKDYKFSKKELNEKAEKINEEKIKNKDRRINITYELNLTAEKLSSAIFKFKEAKDQTKKDEFKKIILESQADIRNLLKMKEERDLKEEQKEKEDMVNNINKINIERQKKIELETNFLRKKTAREEPSMFKRKTCNPMGLWNADIKMDKKDEEKEEQIKKMKSQHLEEEKKKNEPKESDGMRNFKRLRKLEKRILEKTPELEALMLKDDLANADRKASFQNEIESENNDEYHLDIDMDTFFKLAHINESILKKKIDEYNASIKKESNIKNITLDQIQ
ncbi:MAG: hypothetical protein MJ252_16430, partial [archaeon]|nr:hypothetical protein [archaeon]